MSELVEVHVVGLERKSTRNGEVYVGDVTCASLWIWNGLEQGQSLRASVKLGNDWILGSEDTGRTISSKHHTFIRRRAVQTPLFTGADVRKIGQGGIVLTVRLSLGGSENSYPLRVRGEFPREFAFTIQRGSEPLQSGGHR